MSNSRQSDSEPWIAVVITCYNYEHYVERAIRSVLDQAGDVCEIVVVDDGSTDGSWEVITRVGVTAFKLENGGQVAACLYGVERTKAPFVLFLDADDELKPGAIDTILARLDPDVAKLQFSLTCVDVDGQVIRPHHPVLQNFRDRSSLERQVLRSGVYPAPPTSGNVFRRDVAELLRECGYEQAVDGVIQFAAPFMGDVVSLQGALGIYRIHERNKSGMGRRPQAAIFERNQRRFLLRIDHLRDIVRRYQPNALLVEARDTYYFNSLLFCAAICSGRRLGFGGFLKLMRALASEPFPVRAKLVNAAFCLVTYLAPADRAQALLGYRLAVARPTARTLFRAAFVGG